MHERCALIARKPGNSPRQGGFQPEIDNSAIEHGDDGKLRAMRRPARRSLAASILIPLREIHCAAAHVAGDVIVDASGCSASVFSCAVSASSVVRLDAMQETKSCPEPSELLGASAKSLLEHRCQTIPRESLHLPGPDFVDRIFAPSDRNVRVLANLQRLFDSGRLAGTGYVSILPVDQGIEHSAGASFAKNPAYFDPENIVKLAIEGGCNGVASTFGVLGAVARRYAHKIPFIVKINHNELLTYPNKHDQILFGTVERAFDMGAAAVGATIYFGSDEAARQIVEVAEAFDKAHELGMATILWCYLRNAAFTTPEKDYHVSADLTGQANHLGVTIQADIIKQKLPENNGGYNGPEVRQDVAAGLRKTDDRPSDRPVPLPGRQLLHGPHRADQFGRRLVRRVGSGRSRADRGHQQARRRHGPDQRPQSVPAADGRGRQAAQCDPGRVPRSAGDDCVIG